MCPQIAVRPDCSQSHSSLPSRTVALSESISTISASQAVTLRLVLSESISSLSASHPRSLALQPFHSQLEDRSLSHTDFPSHDPSLVVVGQLKWSEMQLVPGCTINEGAQNKTKKKTEPFAVSTDP